MESIGTWKGMTDWTRLSTSFPLNVWSKWDKSVHWQSKVGFSRGFTVPEVMKTLLFLMVLVEKQMDISSAWHLLSLILISEPNAFPAMST